MIAQPYSTRLIFRFGLSVNWHRFKISRRRFLCAAFCSAPVLALAEGFWVEPTWIKIHKLRLAKANRAHRFLHFTDLHYKGDWAFLQAVVNHINRLSPEFVCFTGDIVEETDYLSEALEILCGIKTPMFGIPGNHDYWSGADFEVIARSFEATGGAWLLDQQRMICDGAINLMGATCEKPPQFELSPSAKNILLIHYPEWADKLGAAKFDLILAGHSHGGQVRLPFFGALVVPFGVGRYDLGLFQSPAGPLYVNAGIGCFYLNVRFNCRPEITVVEV